MRVLILQIVLVLIGIQVAGEWIDGFEQSVQSAQGDALHVRLFHVFTLYAMQHFGVHAKLRIRPVARGASASYRAENQQQHDAGGGGDYQVFDTAVHKDSNTW